jgi:SAM-dependent methyltransferase
MCGGIQATRLKSVDRAGKTYHLALCRICGLHYCDPVPTEEEIVGFYQGDYHQQLRQEGATERIFRNKFLRYRDWVLTFVQGGRSMDMGTATGLFPSLLKAAGFDAEGLEYNQASAEWGSTHYGVRIRAGGMDVMATEPGCYDFISMTDVLEHTHHPLHALQRISRSLKPHGHMLITFPDITSVESKYQCLLVKLTGRDWLWSNCDIPFHVWEFTPDTAKSMFDKAGFDVVGFRRAEETADALPGIAGLLMMPLNLLTLPALARRLGTRMEFMIRRRS